ncbi:hypothetical protein EF294_03575 [Gordonia oryzae]|uniref:Uncharacterized protein n=1 Tax=Gordonia oryzae TaxID=2487349 RepID=A0A3N4GS75_9ACTN|nr:hypothetical protein [Gordonia oryzae]RPA65829.1 hypothetical protein EF294_03575 [Gordonia oryzae]
MMTHTPEDMPRDYSEHAAFTAALYASGGSASGYEVYAALQDAVEKYGILPDQPTAAEALAIDTHGRWDAAGRPVLEDRDLYDALWAYQDALDAGAGASLRSALQALSDLAAEGRYFSLGRRHDQLLAALATSERLNQASDQILLQAVQSARDAGMSWDYIGDALGIARQNAYRRFAHRVTTPVTTKRSR